MSGRSIIRRTAPADAALTECDITESVVAQECIDQRSAPDSGRFGQRRAVVTSFGVGIPLYPNFDSLDVCGPLQTLLFAGTKCT